MRFSAAVAASVAAHVALVAGVAVCFRIFPPRAALPELDLSSVEISFAEEEDDMLPAVSVPELPPVPPPAPDVSGPPPCDAEPVPVLPPDPESPAIPEPPPERESMPSAPEPEPRRDQASAPEEPVPVSAAPRQAKVDAPPRPVKAIRPDYPRGARQRGEQGSVVLELSVDERGAVSGVAVAESSGYSELDAAAERAARAARFSPARAEGRPVASAARLTLTFRLK